MDVGQSSDVNISDVIEVIETDEMYAGESANGGETDSRRPRAYVKIIEQPASKALRFRYECEGRSAGSIPGVNSTPENKTFPGIQIVGHHGRAVVVVSCVTKDAPYRPHPHNLVGKEGCSRGVCTLKMNSDTITFSNLGIQCVKKKDIEEALKVREEIRVDPFRTGFSHKVQPSSIDLNSVRLCFQVFLEGPKKDEFTIPLRPVVSDPIYDKKAMSDLTICKLSDCSATVAGGREIILLCEKVAKEDIQVRFYEERDGDVYWEALGDFQPTHVHKQVAISFRTPKYKNLDIDKPVKVWVQLRRPSDGAVSESVPFQFIPLDSGRATFWSLRRALSKKGDYNTFSNILTVNTALLTGNRPAASPETQKRKLEALTPVVLDEFSERKKPLIERESEGENKKDALISGGALVVLPPPQLTVYEKEPKVLGLDISKPVLPLSDHPLLENEQKSDKADVLERNNFDMDEQNNNIQNEEVVNEEDKKLEEPMVIVDEKKDLYEDTLKEIENNEVDNENSQSFNDLITQVAELDEIYSESQNRLVLTREELEEQLEDVAMDCRELFDDSQTYSSLQMAMKNPIDLMEMRSYEDVTPVQGPIIDIGKPKTGETINIDKLPPLPPKRIKKTPPRRPDASPPSKDLPKTPDSVKSKQSIFSKFFSKKKNEKNDKIREKSVSSESLKFGSRTSLTNLSFKDNKKKTSLEDVSSKNTEKGFSKWFHRGSTGNLVDNKASLDVEKTVVNENNENIKNNNEHDTKLKETGFLEDFDINKSDLELGLDLTEAENYALYTSMAPHASVSEFDEMSFYYSPVEGGKILTQEQYERKMRHVEIKNINKPQNVPS